MKRIRSLPLALKRKGNLLLSSAQEEMLFEREERSERELERFCSHLSGFVDGEGCFSVFFRRRSKLSLGIEVTPRFAIGQKKTKQNYLFLEKIRKFFAGGAIRDDGRGCYKYESRSLPHLRSRVLPFFLQYPLQTSKRVDCSSFSTICSLIASKQHLRRAGLLEILALAKEMNPSGKRRFPIEELQRLLGREERL